MPAKRKYKEPVEGDMFGSYTFVEKDHVRPEVNWVVRCLCGKIKSIQRRTLTQGRAKMCRNCSQKKRSQKLFLSKKGKKVCARCKKSLPFEAFPACNSNNDKRGYVCRLCKKIEGKESKQFEKDKLLNKLKTAIKNETIYTPTKHNKSLWNGVGRWVEKYPDIDRCVECDSNLYRHGGHGACIKCMRTASKDEHKRKMTVDKNYREKFLSKQRKQAKARRVKINEIYEKALAGEYKENKKIENILNNIK